MWAWQGQQHQAPQQDGGQSNNQVAGQQPQSSHATQGGSQPQELTDMFQMLDQSGASGFDDIHIFNSTFD